MEVSCRGELPTRKMFFRDLVWQTEKWQKMKEDNTKTLAWSNRLAPKRYIRSSVPHMLCVCDDTCMQVHVCTCMCACTKARTRLIPGADLDLVHTCTVAVL
jgi:hypothetical protein